MPPKGWKKPVDEMPIKQAILEDSDDGGLTVINVPTATIGQLQGAITGAAIAAPQVGQQFPQPTQNIPQMQAENMAPPAPSMSQVRRAIEQGVGSMESRGRSANAGLSSHLDAAARARIGAVNDVQIVCRSALGRFDFKAMWLKKFPDEIPAGEAIPRLKDAIRAGGEVYINCKQRRVVNGEISDVTLDSSRHEANWLKEYV